MLLLLMDENPGIELNILIHLSYNIFIENFQVSIYHILTIYLNYSNRTPQTIWKQKRGFWNSYWWS